MKRDFIIGFAISITVCAFGLMAHVNDTELSYDYGHQYDHEKKEFESKPHHDGEFFPNYNDWLGNQLEKEAQAKTLIDKAIGYFGQYADPLTGGFDASNHICNATAPDDHDRPSAEHESERP